MKKFRKKIEKLGDLTHPYVFLVLVLAIQVAKECRKRVVSFLWEEVYTSKYFISILLC